MDVTSGVEQGNARRLAISAAVIILCHCTALQSQVTPGKQPSAGSQNQLGSRQEIEIGSTAQDSEAELQTGSDLTRKGLFNQAIPHLLAARGRASNEYAANFNLALCYLGTNQFKQTIQVLRDLINGGHDSGDIENLLAQAYIGNQQSQEALASVRKGATLSPRNEKMYLFVADACRDHRDYGLGLHVVDIGLQNLPQSARLHYERAIFLTQLDEIDRAKPDFELAGKLAQGSEIGYLAAVHQKLSDGKISEAVLSAREGIAKGYESPGLLTIFGEALLRSGIVPGQPEFAEAQSALEKAVAVQPNDAASQLALGSLFLASSRLEDAIAHLEKARQLEPGSPSVYANLARAYQRHGDSQGAQEALLMLQKLNQDEAKRISSAPGDRKLGYADRGVAEGTNPHP